MITTRKRILIFALILCGLASAPFGSLEQLHADGDRTATLPCPSAAGATPLPLHSAMWHAALPVRPLALPAEWSLTIPHTPGAQSAATPPGGPPCTVTYYATAPPAHLI